MSMSSSSFSGVSDFTVSILSSRADDEYTTWGHGIRISAGTTGNDIMRYTTEKFNPGATFMCRHQNQKVSSIKQLSQLSHMHCNPDCIQRSCVNTYREPPEHQISVLMTRPQYKNLRVICIGQDLRASAGWRWNTTTDRDDGGGSRPERPNETSVYFHHNHNDSQHLWRTVMRRLSIFVLHVWTDRWGQPPM